ncbi:hypothetical protein PF002_g30045, partial [Phytophthora fragariae]
MTIIARTSSSSGPTDIAIVGVSTSLSDRNVSCIAPLRQIVRQLKAKDHAKMPSNIFRACAVDSRISVRGDDRGTLRGHQSCKAQPH